MSGSKPLQYFDSCVFIAMLTNEQRPGSDSSHVAGLASQIDSREIIAVTSSLTRVEVLECELTSQQTDIFDRLLKRRNMQVKDATGRIMNLAHDIRNFYKEQRNNGESALPTVSTPDAIHLATAIFYECGVFYTFDEKNKKKSRGLIPLSGNVAGRYNLTICKPFSEQMGLSI